MIDIAAYIRWLLMGALVISSGLYGWTQGAIHGERRLSEYVRAVDTAAARQQVRVANTEAGQRSSTQEIHHETVARIARSDEHYRLRWPAGSSGALPQLAGRAGAPNGPAPESALDSPGNPGGAFCADPADAAADAIVILEWQRWFKQQQQINEAQK